MEFGALPRTATGKIRKSGIARQAKGDRMNLQIAYEARTS
jgi:hypothetical protein